MKMVKLLSGFSITGRNEEIPEATPESDPDDPFAGMDPAKSGELMKELESFRASSSANQELAYHYS